LGSLNILLFRSEVLCFSEENEMRSDNPTVLQYKRSRFVTQLPVQYRYSPSHYWMARGEGGLWRIGLTKFATRMLGEMVENAFDVKKGDPVQGGQILGWIEGFKAISDIFCIAEGTFAQANPALREKITLVNKDPYGAGWLYTVEGGPDACCVDVQAYKAILDKTIDKILEQQKGWDQAPARLPPGSAVR
jgi:glycine cleavage system H protein